MEEKHEVVIYVVTEPVTPLADTLAELDVQGEARCAPHSPDTVQLRTRSAGRWPGTGRTCLHEAELALQGAARCAARGCKLLWCSGDALHTSACVACGAQERVPGHGPIPHCQGGRLPEQ